MKYDFEEKQLEMVCINLSDEIKGDDELLNNEDVTIFNSSMLPLKNSDDLLIASRGWYGNIRSWDGINFVILSLFTKDLKKKKQNILDIDKKVFEDKKRKFKELKNEVIPHGDKLLKGPEDPRLFYHNDDIYILINDLTDENKRHMFVSKVDPKKLEYKEKIELCESLSSKFEKNWGPFIYDDKLHLVYDINPLKVFELEDDFECNEKFSVNSEIMKKLTESYPDLHFHIRNSTNLISLDSNEYLGLGHGVLDYKDNIDINKYLIPLLKDSKYSDSDKDYFNRFYKLYTGFFYKLNMERQEITEISPFFQLPNYESKQELIFFPTSIHLDNDNNINISYNVGDNRSYFLKLPMGIIDISLYDIDNIDFTTNFDINLNYYLELIRNIRKLMGFSTKKSDYYKFGDVNKIYSGSKKTMKKNISNKKKPKKTKKISKINQNKKVLYFFKEDCHYCSKFHSIWEKLQNYFSDKNIKFMKINGPKNMRMNRKYNIEMYPTIILIENGNIEYFEGKKSFKNLKEFILN